MKMENKMISVNVSVTALQTQAKQGILKFRGLHKAFIKGGILLLVKLSKLPQIKMSLCKHVNPLLLEDIKTEYP